MLTKEQQLFLAGSADFARVLEADEILRELERDEVDRVAEVAETLECLGAVERIGTLAVRPLTLAQWSLLWCLGNNFVLDETAITPVDVDVFLYVLVNDVAPDPHELELVPARAGGFCGKIGVAYPEAAAKLLQLTARAFSPRAFLPCVKRGADSSPLRFDAEWMIYLAGVAVRESGHDMHYVLHQMPLASVLFCLVNHLRRHDDKGIIYRHTGENITARIVERVEDLGLEFCRQHFVG